MLQVSETLITAGQQPETNPDYDTAIGSWSGTIQGHAQGELKRAGAARIQRRLVRQPGFSIVHPKGRPQSLLGFAHISEHVTGDDPATYAIDQLAITERSGKAWSEEQPSDKYLEAAAALLYCAVRGNPTSPLSPQDRALIRAGVEIPIRGLVDPESEVMVSRYQNDTPGRVHFLGTIAGLQEVTIKNWWRQPQVMMVGVCGEVCDRLEATFPYLSYDTVHPREPKA